MNIKAKDVVENLVSFELSPKNTCRLYQQTSKMHNMKNCIYSGERLKCNCHGNKSDWKWLILLQLSLY